jgi:hexosaminidase
MKRLGIETYTEYQNTFMNRLIDYLEAKGRHCIVWNEAAGGANLDKRAIIQYWKENQKPSVDFINNGGKAILSPFSYVYLDYDYLTTPLNRVYSLKPDLRGLTEEGKKNIIGVEAPIWTEYISDMNRLEELTFPRLIAVSKIANGENNKPYNEFLKEVKKIKNQLGGYNFCNEKMWTLPRAATILGWLRFVKDHYTVDFVKEQLFKG